MPDIGHVPKIEMAPSERNTEEVMKRKWRDKETKGWRRWGMNYDQRRKEKTVSCDEYSRIFLSPVRIRLSPRDVSS
jgi:hypothetical protein